MFRSLRVAHPFCGLCRKDGAFDRTTQRGENSNIFLNRKQPPKERAVPAQSDAQIFRGNISSAIPLALQLRSLLRELLRESLHRSRHKTVRFLDGTPRLVHKAHLNCVPSRAQVPGFLLREQWT